MRRAALAACLLCSLAGRVAAQSPAPAPAGPDFLPRVNFHLSANALVLPSEDQRFKWDAYFGGDVDIFDYVVGRVSVLADYHAVLGDEYRPFDPNQAYYALEVSSSYRAGETEIAGVFHHVSRHLSDRPKQFAIAWNVAGARVLRRFSGKAFTVDARLGGGAIVQHSYVDYTWTADGDVVLRHAVSPRLGVFGHLSGELFTVDGTVPDRGTQDGGLVEAGLRINGRAGALELFAGVERRLDADPLDRQTHRWGIAGFRLLSR
jgi:hypothetical protein